MKETNFVLCSSLMLRANTRFVENRCTFVLRTWRGKTMVQPMIRQAAPKGVEVVVTLPQRVEKSVEVTNINIRGLARVPEIQLSNSGAPMAEGLVGTECGKHPVFRLDFAMAR